MHTLVARLLSRKPHWALVILLVFLLVMTLAATASAQTFLGAQSTVASGISSPMGVAADSFGNLYVLSNTAQPSVVKIDAATRAVSTYIASGTSINSLVLNRWIGYASGYLKIDAANNLYIPDGTNHRIVQWSTASNSWVRDWQTADAPIDVAFDSSGALWYTSPGGIYRFNTGSTTLSTLVIDANAMAPATNPRTLAFDSADNLFFTDEISFQLYESTQSGGYSTFALPVSRTGLDVYLDRNDNLFLGSSNQIWRYDSSTAYAVGMPLTASFFSQAHGLAGDRGSNLFFAENLSGAVTEYAAVGNFGAVNVGATSSPLTLSYYISPGAWQNYAVLDLGIGGARFNQVASPPAGECPLGGGHYAGLAMTCTVTVAFTPTAPGQRNGSVRMIDDDNQPHATALLTGTGAAPQVAFTPAIINTVAGNGNTPYSPGDGSAATGTGMDPQGIVFDGAGNLYISDTANRGVRMVDAVTQMVSTIAGGTLCESSVADFPWCGDEDRATNAAFVIPTGIAIDGAGNLYVADPMQNRVRKIDALPPNHIHNLAGNPTLPTGYSGDGGPATSAQIAFPWGVAVDAAGNVFITDITSRVRRVDAVTGIITTVAGNGTACNPGVTPGCGDGGPATSAQLNSPFGLSFDGTGNLFIADQSDSTVRRVDAASGIITTVAGSHANYCTAPDPCGDGGAASAATLAQPVAVRVDAAGNLYLSDAADLRVRMVEKSTGIISTIAGNRTQCTNPADPCGDGGAATAAKLDWAYGLALDPAQQLYLADFVRVRQLSGVASLSFPDTNVGSSSPSQYVRMFNIGNAQLNPKLASVPVADFIQGPLNTCFSTIASGASCLWDYNFSPSVAGQRSGNVSLLDNSLNQHWAGQSFSLSGKGLSSTLPSAIAAAGASTLYSTSDGTVTLSAIVTASSPVNEGTVTFTVSRGGTGIGVATTSGTVSNGMAGVTFTVPGGTAAGTYSITATYNPATVSPQFLTSTDSSQTLLIAPATPLFSSLSAPTVTYGATAVTLGGRLASVTVGGSPGSVPVGQTVAISVNGQPGNATVDGSGAFSAVFDPHTFPVSGSPYTVSYSYAGNGNFLPQNSSGTLTIQPAPLTIRANNRGKTYGSTLTLGTTAFTITSGTLYNSDAVTGVTLDSDGALATARYVAPGPTYSIDVGHAVGSGLSNYTINYVEGTLTISQAPLTITANDRAKTYGTTLALGTTGFTVTSGTLYNGDTVTGVTLTSAGAPATATVAGSPYPVVPGAALGAGVGNYAITYVNGALTVNPALLTITASPQSKTYGSGTVVFGLPAFAVTSGTLYNSDAVTGVTFSSTGTAATATISGSPYALVPSAATGTGLANYTITYANGTLTVNPAPLTITANSQSKTYGTALTLDPAAFTVTSGTLFNGNTVIGVTLASAGAASTATIAGSPYDILAGSATGTGLTNYTITYAKGLLTVTGKAASVTPANQTKVYGTSDPSLTGTLTGFAAGDGVSASYARTAGETVAGSPYTISATLTPTGALPNYSITYNTGTLTIAKAGTIATVQSSAANVLLKSSVAFTAHVASATNGIPTGTVTFFDGATSLGTGSLNTSGDATLTLATLTAGTHTLTASFGGDANFNTSVSTGVPQSVQDFQILVNGASVTDGVATALSQTVSAGQVATYTFTVAPTPGATFPGAVALSLAGLPSGFSYTISPSTLAAGSGSQTVTVSILTAAKIASAPPATRAPRGMVLAMMLPVFGLLGSWFGLRRTKPRVRHAAWLMLLMLALGVMGMVACGGGTTGYYDYKLASYTLQLNGTGGALQHFTTFNLTVK